MSPSSWFLDLYLQVVTFYHLFNQLSSIWILSLKAFIIPSSFIMSINLISISSLDYIICKSITRDRVLCYDSDFPRVYIIVYSFRCTVSSCFLYVFYYGTEKIYKFFFLAEKCVAKITAFRHLPVWQENHFGILNQCPFL